MEQSVELPGGYDYAWSNGLDEYILTNDVSFDPNLGSTVNWDAMERRQVGGNIATTVVRLHAIQPQTEGDHDERSRLDE